MKNLAKALSLFQGELKPIPKDSENPFFRSAYSSLNACWEAVRPLLSKHGLAVSQITGLDGNTIVLKTILLHESGEQLEGVYPVFSKDNTPQSLGSALTYAERYALKAILGLASTDDDDAEGAQVRKPAHINTFPKATQVSSPITGGPTEKQIQRLMAIANKAGWNEQDIKEYLAQIGLKSRRELNRLQYDALCERMEAYPKIEEKDFEDVKESK